MNSVPVRQIAAATLVLVLIGAFSLPSSAQQQRAERAAITVYQIEASNEPPGGVDPQIKSLVDQFEGTLRYSTYKLVSKTPERMSPGDKEKLAIPGHREMHLNMLGYEGNYIRLKVRVIEKNNDERRELLDTEFRLVEGGTVLIGGYGYRDGKLIVAISAK